MKQYPAHIWLWLAFLITFPLLFRFELAGSDPLGYYSWLRSAVLDHDLDVANEFHDLRFDSYHQVTTATGHRYNHWSIGPALLWSPLYLLAHALNLLLGSPWPADGYSLPYTVAAAFASTLYAFIGVLLLYDIARRFVSPSIAALATGAVWFASPLIFYMYSHPFMSHAVDFFANALFVWVWIRSRDTNRWQGWLARGATIGLAILIRPQNGLLILFPTLELLWMLFGQASAHNINPAWQNRLRRAVALGLSLGAGMLIFLLPQMIFWRIVFGYWLYNAYEINYGFERTTLNLAQPHLLELAFSNNHGLFVWSPILLPALFGLVLLFRRDRRLAAMLTINLALQYYLISSLSTWHGGGPSFGARYLIGVLPAFFIGLALLFQRLRGRIHLRWLLALSAFFIIWNLLLIVQYTLETIPRSGPADLLEMAKNQFTVIPENALRLLQILSSRSSR